jgi:hypothetical protein
MERERRAVLAGPDPRNGESRESRPVEVPFRRFTERREVPEAYLPHFNVLVVYFFSLRKNSPSL